MAPCIGLYDMVVTKAPAEAWDPRTGSVVTAPAGTRGAVIETSCPGEWLMVECEIGIVDVRRKDVARATPRLHPRRIDDH